MCGSMEKLPHQIDIAMIDFIYAPAFDANLFKKAVENFRNGSVANQNGMYGYGSQVPVSQNPLIKQLYPLRK